MNCPYLDGIGHCRASPLWNNIYNPTEEEKEDYCTDELEMRCCPRLQLFQSHLEAINSKGANVSNINTNTSANTNINTNVVNLSVEIREAFEIAYATVEAKKDISQDEKDVINGRLLVLERELAKDPEKIDASKVQRLRAGFEKYGWLIPIIIEITKKALGT
jgi:hypothetical protein